MKSQYRTSLSWMHTVEREDNDMECFKECITKRKNYGIFIFRWHFNQFHSCHRRLTHFCSVFIFFAYIFDRRSVFTRFLNVSNARNFKTVAYLTIFLVNFITRLVSFQVLLQRIYQTIQDVPVLFLYFYLFAFYAISVIRKWGNI